MKRVLFAILLVMMTYAAAGAQTVNVTFWMNTATVPDTVTPNSMVQIRGGTAPLTWSDDTGGQLQHVDGDLWSVTLAFNAGDMVDYKFNVRTDVVQGGDGWESNVNTANNNRNLVVGQSDTTLPVQFYNGTSGNDPLYRPYTETDTIDVYLRINMQGFANFNADNEFVGTRGQWPEGNGDWSTPVPLTQETGSDNDGQFTYPADNFWSGVTHLPASAIGDTINYKFVTLDGPDASAGTKSWEDNIPDNRKFIVGPNDTTVVWDWFDGAVPIRASNSDTVDLTFTTDITRAIQSRGFTPGDTLFARVGFAGTANELVDVPMVSIEGTSLYFGRDTLVATLGGVIEYDYRLKKFGQEIRESYFDFDFVPESQTEQGRAERRRASIDAQATTITDADDDDFSPHRQPFFPSNEVLSQNVLMTFEVDMRPAIFELLFSNPTDTLLDIQGGRDIAHPDSVLKYGVRINGLSTGDWQSWGGTLNDDTTRTMYDDGTNGDAVAGDSIYTRQYMFSPDSMNVGTMGRVGQVFKFGVWGGDNEGGFGNNHVANVDDSQSAFTIHAQFGSIDPKKYDHWDYNAMVSNPTSVERVGDFVPGKFALDHNFPNPFNPETSITYSIPRSGDVKLTVYNLIGQQIATLVAENQVAGNYHVRWNGQNDAGRQVASGFYVYKLEAGNFVQTRKMLLLK